MLRSGMEDFMDSRISLIDIAQKELYLDEVYEINFEEPVGRGGTCLVYHAFKIIQTETQIYRHKVILKEFYPILTDQADPIQRTYDGRLLFPESVNTLSSYKRKLKRFSRSFEIFLELHNDKQTNPFIVDADQLVEGNGTWYLIVDYNNACSLSDYMKQQPNLHDFVCVMKQTAEAVLQLHQNGWLHLDLTPGNLLLSRNHAVRFLDTDSMLKKADICKERPILSFSAGYSAPEIKSSYAVQILPQFGEKADIYSLGAIFYHYLTDTPPALSNIAFSKERIFQTADEKYARSVKGVYCCSHTVKSLLFDLLHGMLSSSLSERFDSLQEIIPMLDTLISLSRPERIYIPDLFTKNPEPVYGMEENLACMSRFFHTDACPSSSSYILCISGMGGMGKSTLAREYAHLHAREYKTIVEVTADSAEDVINKIYLANYDDKQKAKPDYENAFSERLMLMKRLLSESKTLILVHDYNQRQDNTFSLFRELNAHIILTGWADLSDTGIPCIFLKPGTLSLNAAKLIFQNAYFHNARQTQSKGWISSLEQILASEKKELDALLKKVDCHPLTIRLLGMQMSYERNHECTPSQMLQELEVHGFTEDEWIELPNSKDNGNIDLGDICYHLSKLFDSTLRQGKLKAQELEALRYLTLLPTESGISRTEFINWTGLYQHGGKLLENLSKKGWLLFQYDPDDEDNAFDFAYEGTYYMPMVIAEMLYRRKDLQTTVSNSAFLIDKFISADKHYRSSSLYSFFLYSLGKNFLHKMSDLFLSDRTDLLYACGHSLFRYLSDQNNVSKLQLLFPDIERCLTQVLKLQKPTDTDSIYSLALTHGLLAILYLKTEAVVPASAVLMNAPSKTQYMLDLIGDDASKVKCYAEIGNLYYVFRYHNLALSMMVQAVSLMEQVSDFPLDQKGKIYEETGFLYLRMGQHSMSNIYLDKANTCYQEFYQNDPEHLLQIKILQTAEKYICKVMHTD